MNFDAKEYFTNICNRLKRTKNNGYFPCSVTGLGNMEGVLSSFQNKRAYFAIDTTNDGYTFQGQGGGYFQRKMYIVYLLKKIQENNLDQQQAALNECRNIYRSICTKLIKDKSGLENDMIFLRTDRIPFYEITGYGIAGCTGLYFMVNVDVPTNLCYDFDEWDE